jgi:hypothetical protein
LLTDYGTEHSLVAGEQFSWKRTGFSVVINSPLEGALIRVTTTVNNSILFMNTHLGVTVSY